MSWCRLGKCDRVYQGRIRKVRLGGPSLALAVEPRLHRAFLPRLPLYFLTARDFQISSASLSLSPTICEGTFYSRFHSSAHSPQHPSER
jgi:hypothetical protein